MRNNCKYHFFSNTKEYIAQLFMNYCCLIMVIKMVNLYVSYHIPKKINLKDCRRRKNMAAIFIYFNQQKTTIPFKISKNFRHPAILQRVLHLTTPLLKRKYILAKVRHNLKFFLFRKISSFFVLRAILYKSFIKHSWDIENR